MPRASAGPSCVVDADRDDAIGDAGLGVHAVQGLGDADEEGRALVLAAVVDEIEEDGPVDEVAEAELGAVLAREDRVEGGDLAQALVEAYGSRAERPEWAWAGEREQGEDHGRQGSRRWAEDGRSFECRPYVGNRSSTCSSLKLASSKEGIAPGLPSGMAGARKKASKPSSARQLPSSP